MDRKEIEIYPMQNQFPRIFAYSTLALMLSALYYVFTHGFYQYIEMGGMYALGTWLGLIITIAHVNYMLSKRFITKAFSAHSFPYVMSVIFVLPIVVQIVIRDEAGVFEMQPVLFTVLLIAAFLGAYVGSNFGKKAQIEWLKKLEAKKNQQV
jgi:ABC-type uncharacterized transport system permease subunit